MNKSLIVIIVLILLGVNVWQWWPDQSQRSTQLIQNVGELSLLALPLPDYSRDSRLRILVDPFFGEEQQTLTSLINTPERVDATSTRHAKDPFKDYQLAGILYKNGRMNAFMVVSGTSHIVVKGDIINGLMHVDRITETSVTLRHNRNNQKRTIKLQ
ncbi:MAG: hypothetical protein OQL09_09675 [Gammaproteobacteria bacterium]|nr:hypothetical protein [Gammaproteobacteria bacterium]